MTARTVSVVIAAHDCIGTIDRAIASALAQPETAEVIVVDDASSDGTRARAQGWTRRDGRVRVIPMTRNAGPAGARNRAFDAATGDLLAILDSDDFFAPDRFAHLLAARGWDMVADNVVFVREAAAEGFGFDRLPVARPGFVDIDMTAFANGNRTDGRRARGEMGFLKPLLSRAFLNRHGLRYDETLRLGEDYDLYARMLLAGARFRVTFRPGYGAVVRGASLSARHATSDLARLDAAMSRHLDMAPDAETRAALEALRSEIRLRHDHRHLLDIKAKSGLAAALRFALATPGRFGPLLRAVAADKFRLRQSAADPFDGASWRLLLSPPD